jgi:DNA-binding LytR/AlgR family response regulator
MNNIDIVLVEDDPIDTIKIQLMVSEFLSDQYRYRLVGTFNEINSAIHFVEQKNVDIIISDIFTKKKPTGIELLKKLHGGSIPIVFITQSQDQRVYQEAKKYRELSYLIKPFHLLTLQATIEKVISESNRDKNHCSINKEYLFLKNKQNNSERVNLEEILFLEAEGNYCFIHTINKKYVQKKSLTKILDEDLNNNFIRIHHSFAINKQHIKSLKNNLVKITNSIELPVSKSFKKYLVLK